MNDYQPAAREWVTASLNATRQEARYFAVGMCAFALGVMFVWTVCVAGLLLGISFVLAYAGVSIGDPWLYLLAAFVAQFLLYPMARGKDVAGWQTERDVDGVLWVIPPDNRSRGLAWFDQGSGFSVRRTVASLFFAVPLALEQAWQHWNQAGKVKGFDTDGLAKLVARLIEGEGRAPVADLAAEKLHENLDELLLQAVQVPGIVIVAGGPQTVRLTDAVFDELIAPYSIPEADDVPA